MIRGRRGCQATGQWSAVSSCAVLANSAVVSQAKWVELHSKGPNWDILRCSSNPNIWIQQSRWYPFCQIVRNKRKTNTSSRSRCKVAVQTAAYISRERMELKPVPCDVLQRWTHAAKARPAAAESLQHPWLKAQEAEDSWLPSRICTYFSIFTLKPVQRFADVLMVPSWMRGSDLGGFPETLFCSSDLARSLSVSACLLPQGEDQNLVKDHTTWT